MATLATLIPGVRPQETAAAQLRLWHPVPDYLLDPMLEAMITDPLRTECYTDLFPTTRAVWHAQITGGLVQPWLWSIADTPGGLYWLHDQGRSAEGRPFAWAGMYVLPGYRGRSRRHWYRLAWQFLVCMLADSGVQAIFIACRRTNIPANQAARDCGFHTLGMYPGWHRFEGRWDDVFLYSWRAEDEMLAWAEAKHRHEEVRAMVDREGYV